jgi:hypothetical protein
MHSSKQSPLLTLQKGPCFLGQELGREATFMTLPFLSDNMLRSFLKLLLFALPLRMYYASICYLL